MKQYLQHKETHSKIDEKMIDKLSIFFDKCRNKMKQTKTNDKK